MTDSLPVLQEFYREKLAALLSHQAGARLKIGNSLREERTGDEERRYKRHATQRRLEYPGPAAAVCSRCSFADEARRDALRYS